MQVNVVNLLDKDSKSNLNLDDKVFAAPYSEGLVHQVIVSYMAAARAGTKQNKGRSDVRGGGAKPWRQKGTGRARAGTNTSPIWRGGGVTFAARPRSFEKKVNKKMYRGAMRSILSEQIRKGALVVIEDLKLETHKTKDFLNVMSANNIDNAIFVEETLSENTYFASRNIPNIWAIDFFSLNPYDLYTAKKLVMTTAVMQKIEEWLS
ncbi:MAG: 50S ribosomal protein L4 [Pseudomonadota bacterium]|nr:50S ribosomal protein L4 [Pseudomonadota bacterium]